MGFLKGPIGTAIGLGGAGLSAILGRGGSNPLNPNQQQLLDRLLNKTLKISSFGFQGAKQDIPAAREALTSVMNFLNPLLTGDRTAIANVLGPEIRQIGDTFSQASKQTAEFGPRGPTAGALVGLETARARELGELITGARPRAAAALGDIGSRFASLGLGELSESRGALGTGLQALLGIRGQNIDLQGQNSSVFGNLGRIFGAFLGSNLTKN